MAKYWRPALPLLALSITAAPATALAADFCKKPYEAICPNPFSISGDRSERLGKFKPSDYEKLTAKAQEQIVDVLAPQIKKLVAKGLPKDIRAAVMKTRVLSPWTLDKQTDIPADIRDKLKRSVAKNCGGKDYSKDSGYNLRLENVDYVMICPGFILSSVKSGKSSSQNARSLVHLLAHELGHSIDTRNHSELYENLKECLFQHHQDEYTSRRDLQSYMDEIVADYRSTNAVARYMNANFSGKSEKLKFLQQTYEVMCDSLGDEHHPGDRLRIEALLRQNPAISESMGCIDTKLNGQKGCSVTGEI